MKTIYLLRHAKSSWKDADLSDIDRPLNAKGKKDATMMGKYFFKKRVRPELIVSSPAKRAFKTASIVAEELEYGEKNIHIDMRLYGANTDLLFEILQQLENNLQRVMLVGHNPAFTNVIELLTGASIDNLPTCGMARIDFDTKKWNLIKAQKGQLKMLDYPKKILK
ncbi:MAG: histidine phosphatase family protein [Bacteroidetes bacterium]|nr:histidine phosphatase family protein [Bacteroidota bacterium]